MRQHISASLIASLRCPIFMMELVCKPGGSADLCIGVCTVMCGTEPVCFIFKAEIPDLNKRTSKINVEISQLSHADY